MDVNKELIGRVLGVDPESILTAKEAAGLLGIQHRSVLKAIGRGRLKAKQVGCMWYLMRDDVDRYKENRKEKSNL